MLSDVSFFKNNKQIMAYQVLDIKTQKGMSEAESAEHLRKRTEDSLKEAKRKGNYDVTREHLNFEVGKGCVIKAVDKQHSIPTRMKANLISRGIKDPNEGLKQGKYRTVVNMILGGSRDQMRRLAFGDQPIREGADADNSQVTRQKDIEDWAKDMYQFMAKKYGEENIVAFVVHLDELNPHIHCTLMPIDETGKFNYKGIFNGKGKKFGLSDYYFKLHDELSIINKKYSLDRGSHIADTGARHRSTEEYIRQLDEQREQLEKKCSALQDDIIVYRQTKRQLDDEINIADKRVKGLTTMIGNLEKDKTEIEKQIENLKRSGEESSRETQSKLFILQQQLQTIEGKIEDKQEKLDAAVVQLRQLGEQHRELSDRYEHLQEEINKVVPIAEERAIQGVQAQLSQMMIDDTKIQFSRLSQLDARALDYFEGTLLMDMAEHGQAIMTVAAALFLGYVDQATEFAQTHGGGGGPGSDWGKKDGEDDRQWARRCLAEAAKMMKSNGRNRRR
jgi:hypothetical protein